MESMPRPGTEASVNGRARRPATELGITGQQVEGRVGLAGGDAYVCSSLRIVASRRHRSASMAPPPAMHTDDSARCLKVSADAETAKHTLAADDWTVWTTAARRECTPRRRPWGPEQDDEPAPHRAW
jgi:hypothetical protein